ncbi:MAG: hypothetical protein MK193_08320 [Lentisphaeria bacterium]|nr:hypothetical protein [Lentisphaeria bacterium]
MFYGLFLGCFFVIGLELYEFSYRYIANAALDSKHRYHQESLSIFRIGLFRERIVINPELNYRDSIGILPKFIRIRRGLHFDTEELYFRVTGELRKSAILNDYLEHSPSSFDIHQGDDVVGDIQEDLYMKESILNASIDGKSALSYSEWTMVFSNESYLNQEARAEILLPPGSVVTRLTLWVEGEEREAAFASRGKTSGAYKEIVAQQRDPVLVTTRGRDRVFVQCFPVLPKQSMKIRFGYTTPLVLDRSKQGHYIEPKILDRNFKYKGLNIHEVWLESDANFISRNEDFKVILRDGVYVYHEKFESDYFDNEPNSFDVLRDKQQDDYWVVDPLNEEAYITQHIYQYSVDPVDKYLIVVDTSQSMAKHKSLIIDQLRTMENKVDLVIFVAQDDGCKEISIDELVEYDFIGGRNNIYALENAVHAALEEPSSHILWLHGPQLFDFEDQYSLYNSLVRNKNDIYIKSFQFDPGVNAISSFTSLSGYFQHWRKLKSTEDDFSDFLHFYLAEIPMWCFKREKVFKQPAGEEGSKHIARLWANEYIWQEHRKYGQKNYDDLVSLGASYQLVTPVTGAVVLENEQQYENAGLQPVNAGSVPGIPEPNFILLILMLTPFILFIIKKKNI